MVRLAKAFTRAHIVGPNLSPRPDSPALSVTETKQRPVRKEANEYRANLLVRVAAAYEFQATSAQKQPKDGRYQASADALYKLYHALEAIPLDDPRLVACYRLEMIEWGGPVDEISRCFTERHRPLDRSIWLRSTRRGRSREIFR
jgi:hypothetical protein